MPVAGSPPLREIGAVTRDRCPPSVAQEISARRDLYFPLGPLAGRLVGG